MDRRLADSGPVTARCEGACLREDMMTKKAKKIAPKKKVKAAKPTTTHTYAILDVPPAAFHDHDEGEPS